MCGWAAQILPQNMLIGIFQVSSVSINWAQCALSC